MADTRDPSNTQMTSNKKCKPSENITTDPASNVVAIELNKTKIKAKENEQDEIPSDDEYPDLHLDPAIIAKRKKEQIEKARKQNS